MAKARGVSPQTRKSYSTEEIEAMLETARAEGLHSGEVRAKQCARRIAFPANPRPPFLRVIESMARRTGNGSPTARRNLRSSAARHLAGARVGRARVLKRKLKLRSARPLHAGDRRRTIPGLLGRTPDVRPGGTAASISFSGAARPTRRPLSDAAERRTQIATRPRHTWRNRLPVRRPSLHITRRMAAEICETDAAKRLLGAHFTLELGGPRPVPSRAWLQFLRCCSSCASAEKRARLRHPASRNGVSKVNWTDFAGGRAHQ